MKPLEIYVPVALIFAALLLYGCDSGGGSEGEERESITPDDIEIVSVDPGGEDDGSTLYFEVVTKNNADVTMNGVSVYFRLLDGSTVVASGDSFYGDGLRPGQQVSARALFFDLESFDSFECYEYDVEVVVTEQGLVTDRSYPGTCED